jgi:hypothetical protein
MNKYIVNVVISKFNENGMNTSESVDYTFDSGDLIKDRKNAIQKAEHCIENIDSRLPDGEEFSSPFIVELLGLKKFNCFSVFVNLVNKEGETPIYGTADDKQFAWLEYEANIFREKYPKMKFAQIENPYGDLIEVIDTDLDFLLEAPIGDSYDYQIKTIRPQDNSKTKSNSEDRALSIFGSSRNKSEREPNDFYPTPPEVVEELLKKEIFDGNIWECACGDGAISEVLIKNEYEVHSTDLIDRGYGSQLDFLKSNLIRADNIITNPPYSFALQFLLQAKKHSNKKIAMLLQTTWVEGQRRHDMFKDTEFPLKIIYQFSKRISLYKGGIKTKNSGKTAYAWYVWDKDYVGKTQFDWIK